MTKGEIYRRAAEAVLLGSIWDGSCCVAIYGCGGAGEARLFSESFDPLGRPAFADYWWPDYSDKSQKERSLLLCLAAAMADAGDL